MNTDINDEIEEFTSKKKKIQSKIVEKIKSSNLNAFVKKVYIKLLNHIFKYLENKHILKDKIFFDYQLWLNIHEHSLIKKNAKLVHNLTKFMKLKRFLTSNSKLFPKNQVLSSINPLSKSFLFTDFSNLDTILEKRDKLLEKLESIKNTSSKEKEALIYIYFRLFIVKRIPIFYYQYIKFENIFHLNNQLLLIVKLEGKKVINDDNISFTPLKTFLFSIEESKVIKQFLVEVSSLSKSLFNYDFNSRWASLEVPHITPFLCIKNKGCQAPHQN